MIALTRTFTAEEMRELRSRSIFQAGKLDPQTYDTYTMAPYALRLAPSAWRLLAATAEACWRELHGFEHVLHSSPQHWRALGLGRRLRALIECSARADNDGPRCCRIDFHLTDEGWCASEINADVPGGFIESGAISRLVQELWPSMSCLPDPARELARAVARRVREGSIALVHATSYVDDQQVMRRIGAELQSLGLEAHLASPVHLCMANDRCTLATSGVKVDGIVRFFPGEWLANLRSESRIRWSRIDAGIPQTNPISALLIQSKRLPLVASAVGAGLPEWEAVLPQVSCIGSRRFMRRLVPEGNLLKPAWGRVGEGVCIDGVTPRRVAARWRWLARAFPKSWILQRQFASRPIESDEGTRVHACLGVFVIDGRAAGVYARVAPRALIDGRAQDVALLLDPSLDASLESGISRTRDTALPLTEAADVS